MNEFTKRPSNANVRSNAFYLYPVSLSRINIKAPYKSNKPPCRAVTDKLPKRRKKKAEKFVKKIYCAQQKRIL